MLESFELQRERMQGVTIVTYDELFGRLGRLVALLEGENVPLGQLVSPSQESH